MLKLNMLTYALNAILLPWESLSKYPGYVAIITTILLPFSTLQLDFNVKFYQEKKVLFFLCLIVVSAVTLGLIDANIDQDYILSILGFVSLYATLAVDAQTYTYKDLKQIFTINKCLSLIYILYTLGPFSFKYSTYDEWGNTWFTLGFSNPNTTGAYVMFCVAMLAIEASYKKGWQQKAINIIFMIGLAYIIYLTESRTALICSCLLILTMFTKKIPLKSWYIDVALIVMIAFIAFQIWIASQGEIQFLGKSMASGRQDMYMSFIQEILRAPWNYIIGSIGIYGLKNTHNAAFAIIRSFGLLGLICYVVFWKKIMRNCMSSVTSIVNKTAIFALLIYIIYSSTEAAPMIGMIPHGTPILVIGRLAKDHLPKRSVLENNCLNPYKPSNYLNCRNG